MVKITALASTYTTDNTIARRVDRFSPAPAMMPDRIGIIGNTHGVKARPSPARKKTPNTSQIEPFNARWNWLSVDSPPVAATAASALPAGSGTETVRVISG